MHFSNLALLLSFAISTLAAPACSPSSTTTPTTVPTPSPGSALTAQTYNEFQISAGTSGSALSEVDAKFPIDLSNLASVSASDLLIIAKAAQVGEQAEIAPGGFNDAIAAAGGVNTAAGQALQNGKIKNKVLKLRTDVLRIMIEVAKGNNASAGSLVAQQAKLAKNVQLDEAARGQKSTAVSFQGED